MKVNNPLSKLRAVTPMITVAIAAYACLFFEGSVLRFRAMAFKQYFTSEDDYSTVCNFQSMTSPVELNNLFLKFFCYITWFDGYWSPCKRGLYVKSYCSFEYDVPFDAKKVTFVFENTYRPYFLYLKTTPFRF